MKIPGLFLFIPMRNFTHLKPIVLLIFLCNSWDGNGQTSTLRFKHLTIENGLSHNTVKFMIEDKKGYLWFGTRDGLNKYDGYSFKIYKFDPRDTSSLPQNDITALWADSEGAIWVGTGGGGLSKFNPATETFTEYKPKENREAYRSISRINEDSEGMMWIGTHGGSLHRFNKHTGEFLSNYDLDFKELPDSLKNKLRHERILALYKDRSGTLWIGNMTGLHKLNLTQGKAGEPSQISFTHYKNSPGAVFTIYEDQSGFLWLHSNGLHRFDPTSHTFTHFRHDPQNSNSISNDVISQIIEDKEGNLWIGTLGGLNKLNKQRTQFSVYVNNSSDPSSLSSNFITSLLLDKSGTLWLGTIGNGINQASLTEARFIVYRHNPLQSNSLSDKEVTALYEDRKETVWIGTNNGGLNRLDRKTGKFTHYRHNPSNPKSLWHDYISKILEDNQGNLWISHDNKISKLNKNTGEFERSTGNTKLDEIIGQSRIHAFYGDKEGMIWIGTEYGLIQYNIHSKHYIQYSHDPLNKQGLGDYQVQTVREDSKGNLWIGHGSLALTKLHKKTGKFTWYKHNKHDSTSISSVYVKSIFEDSKGNIWFGTIAGGLCRYNFKEDNFTTYTERDGLANNTVYSILEDNEGNLWLGTNKGLSRFSLSTRTFTNYDVNDGLQSNQFAGGYINLGSCFKGKEGTLYFGGSNGFNVLDPGKFEKNSYVPPIVITGFRLFDTPIAGKQETKAIELTHEQNFFSFEFAALNYINSSKNQYAYMLEGLEEEWVKSGTRRFVNYTDIAPGEYTFKVKGSNNDGLWNEQGASIKITILPPWWRTIWAYSFYTLLFIGALMGFVNFRMQRIRERQEVELKRREAKHLQEVNEIKNRFFSNITHEFRTPLTLILVPTQRLLQKLTSHSPYYMDVQAVERNARHLLRLVNELLDLSKMEAGSLPLNETRGNILSFTAQIVEGFRTAAQEKQILLYFQGDAGTLEYLFDADKWEKIIGNLLSNALKFTPPGGQVQVRCLFKTRNLLEVHIADTGIGIAAEKLPYIFDRFYQADDSRTRTYEGSGIGLALVRELLQLLGGQIEVKSSLGRGTSFIVELPLKKAFGIEDAQLTNTDTKEIFLPVLSENNLPTSFEEPLHSKPLILVVEDNTELLSFIGQLLQTDYRVLTATNGVEGLALSRKELPEIVISDVMMPEMDGYALCDALKTDTHTNHIAVLLLTARASQNSRLEGLSLGADDYITKPFHLEELQLRLRNLLDRQAKLREHYLKQWQGTEALPPARNVKDVFVEKLYTIIEANLDDSRLDPETLASEVAMSVRTLNRKLNTLMGISAAKLIRVYRLKRAAALLRSGQAVSDTAYQVGFESPSYFATAFKEYFQKTPSEYVA